MTTQEFFQIAASHLTDDGVLTMNSASVPGDRRLINGLATTMATIFPSIYTVDIPGSLNTMIFATKQKTIPENFAVNLLALMQDKSIHPLLISTMQVTFPNLKTGYEPTTVFTDDHAPIEWIVNDMVLRFVLEGGTKNLQQQSEASLTFKVAVTVQKDSETESNGPEERSALSTL